MPDIQLQDYTTKIKSLIRDDLHDEAIAHCRHILRHHPKYIEAYCLLGEACLEEEMYREAIEFFQRTLSADPECFIARVGLGIIYDDQGALPQAIWQMERAFELAPGNAEVRRELQRLYAQQEGAERTHLKLTRGALGRLYIRNGFYERAINEFRAVLRKEPDSPHIRVALIEALWREGRRLEAVETCLDLLEALPNCLKANLILGAIWMQGGHEDAGEEKLNIARTLDPENRIALQTMGQDSPLPPEDVRIPELEITPEVLDRLAPAEEAWELGWDAEVEEAEADIEEVPTSPTRAWEADEEIPDWLRDVDFAEIEEAAPSPAHEVPVEQTTSDEEVPDWLQELAGGEAPPVDEEEEEEAELVGEALEEAPEAADVEETEAAPELPDWLDDLEGIKAEEAAPPAPKDALDEVEEFDETVAEVPDWLEELMGEEAPEAEGIAPSPVEETPEEIGEAEKAEESPDWLPELEEAGILDKEIEAPTEAKDAAKDIPQSLQALIDAGMMDESDLETALAEMSPEELEAQRAEAVPEWLQELAGEGEPEEEEAVPPAAKEVLAEEVEEAEE
ncbi:MAG: tetratricopeptide repeat protein, partial [Anaerolineae bacterium]